MAVVKIDKETKDEYIVFKTPNCSGKGPEQARKLISKCIDKHSEPFMGIKLSKHFFQDNGDYKLYGRHRVCVDGQFYYFTGLDTENWKGFKLKIVKCL